MATSKARAALDAWLAHVEEILRASEEPHTRQDWEDEPIEHGDAA